MYQFMSGYQPWVYSNQTATQRAEHLLISLDNNSYRQDLEKKVDLILNQEYAQERGWTKGKMKDRSWQWFNMPREPNLGEGYSDGEAIGWAYVPSDYGDYFWFFTSQQDWDKNH